MKRLRAWLMVGGVVAALVAGGARPARACGGFFCSSVPVDQSGEQIIFSLTPNHVTAYIQISYSGAAKDFAWVVPVSAKPEITLGSQAVFQAVAGLTTPQFRVDWVGDAGFCGVLRGPVLAPGAMTAGAVDDKGVNVLDARDVGPFATVTLQAHDSGELLKWLDDNGFQQPDGALPLIEHYVQAHMLFVALRLKQNATAGDIQPIVLDMASSEPCVPLILTRIAAQNDMPVSVYVLGAHRAFPENWFHVVVDEAKINWSQGGTNYRDLVTAAINEAGGHGFVTEFAGSSTLMKDVIYKAGLYDPTALAGITDPGVLISMLLKMGYPRDASMQALLRKWIPMPASVAAMGVTEQQFYGNVHQYQAQLDAAGYVLDINGFIADLEARLIKPLQTAQAMFDAQPYLTRLLSTVSPEEMTRDPIFTLNAQLPDVSNEHVAKADGTCMPDGSAKNVTLELEDGRRIALGDLPPYYQPSTWTYGQALPAAQRIELVGPDGAAVAVAPGEVASIDKALDTMLPEIVRTMPKSMTPAATGGSGGCACAVPGRGRGRAG
ncbi:MAG: hypothetical protein JWM82_2256, partial [Myxococcales bacterium]|nr:hypothetical protein [Myxococcales bacterium]